jgi:hypothetical protein
MQHQLRGSAGCALADEATPAQLVINVPLAAGARLLTRDLDEPLAKSLGRLRVTLDKATGKGQKGQKKPAPGEEEAPAAAAPPLRYCSHPPPRVPSRGSGAMTTSRAGVLSGGLDTQPLCHLGAGCWFGTNEGTVPLKDSSLTASPSPVTPLKP